MTRMSRVSIPVIDACCAVVCCACVALLASLTVFRDGHADAEVVRLRRGLAASRADRVALQRQLDNQDALLRHRRDLIDSRGRLPDRAPVEAFFQTLSTLANTNDLEVLQLAPHSTRVYPGLTEQRYSYELSGTLAGIARFLYEIEHTEYWADVGYLKIVPASPASVTQNHNRKALLTLSLFSGRRDGVKTGEGTG